MRADCLSLYRRLNSLFCSINHRRPVGLPRLTRLQTVILSLKVSGRNAQTNMRPGKVWRDGAAEFRLVQEGGFWLLLIISIN